MISKLKNKICLIVITFFIGMTVVLAACAGPTISNAGSITYGTRYSANGWETHKYYTDDRTDSSVYNAFCLEPQKSTTGGCDYAATEITRDPEYEQLVRALYYSYNAPGWTSGWANDYNNRFCDGINGNTCTTDEYYAYSHVVLAYLYHLYLQAHQLPDNGWNIGLNADLKQNAEEMALDQADPDYDEPDKGFRVYIVKNSNSQDIIYWTFVQEDACADVVKLNALTDERKTGAKFQLYDDSNCSASHKVGSAKTVNSDGLARWNKLDPDTTYYVKEDEAPTGYEKNTECKKVTTSTTGCPNTSIKNYPIYYCARVKKVDSEDTSLLLNGAKFTFTFTNPVTTETHSYSGTTPGKHSISRDGATSGTTATTGLYIVDMLPNAAKDETVTFTETNSEGDILTDQNGVQRRYWKSVTTVSKSGLTKMSRSGSTYTCPNTDAATVLAKNYRQYACLKVKKVSKTEKITVNGQQVPKPLPGAKFTLDGANEKTADSHGIATWFLGEVGTVDLNTKTYTVKETQAPDGYSIPTPDTKQVKGFLLSKDKTRAEAEQECLGTTWDSKADSFVFEDAKLLINWTKYLENYNSSNNTGTKGDGAAFVVKKGNQYVRTSGTETITDTAGVTKTCYKFSSLTSTKTESSILVSGANGDAGGVCITGLEPGDYVVYEISPVANHTFSTTIYQTITAANAFNTNKVFINEGTYIEVEKQVTDTDRVSNALDTTVLKKIETNKLKKIPFEVYKADSNGNATGDALSFVLSGGVYYDVSATDVSGTTTTTLYLNDDRRIKFSHLAWGSYVLKEKGHKTSDTCVCTNDADCIGYYYPKSAQEVKFTITKCSNTKANMSGANSITQELTGSNVCTITHPSNNINPSKQDNTPTELWFTKKDFYEYEDSEDIADSVNFVDDKERSDFDRITFKVKDASGNYLKFIDIGSHYTDSSKKCLKDDDYHEYRYITDAELNALTAAERSQLTIVTELHTCGGHIRITNLCRGKKYYVEEVSVPEDSVFTLPEGNNPAQVEYTIPCCDDESITPKTSHTIIKDKGTRVRFEKRDSKYNYLIPDETTTFQVYQCNKGTECHPTTNPENMTQAENVRKLMKFTPRAILTKKDSEIPIDEEDGSLNGSVVSHTTTDYERTYEVYKAASDSDIASGGTFVTDLHPDRGILILRYLPAGYNYVLVETKSPQGYSLPTGENRETPFEVVNTTVNVEEINVPNLPVSLIVRKYTDDGNLLEGATFKISKAKNCNMNVAPNKVETVGAVTLKTIRDGVYEARPEGDTTLFKTCKDREGAPCSEVNSTLTYSSSNSYENYTNTFADYQRLVNDRLEKVPIVAGEALIQYLDYGSCYVIEEVKAPDGYKLPEREEDRFVMVKITDKAEIVDTYDQFVNVPIKMPFYKTDEYGQPLDGAKYKLQKLNDNKKYVDVPVTLDTSFEDELVYKIDKNSTNYIMETKNGKAWVSYLEEGQYRILEVEAPEGYELPKKTMNVATFFVDNNGGVYGSNIIANKPVTTPKIMPTEAKATFIVNIATGQTIIKYGLIISVIVLAIVGLLYIQRKNKK